MEKHERRIAAGEFKARCLAIMDEVAATGEEIVITRRGKPVARLSAIVQADESVTRKWLKDAIVSIGDVESPSTELTAWEDLD